MVLTQKESMLIEDLKNEEKICIEKYQKHCFSTRYADRFNKVNISCKDSFFFFLLAENVKPECWF